MQDSKKTIVVTGASSGAGRAIALAFAEQGHNLVLAARNTVALEEVAIECRQLGSPALVVTTDVSDHRSVINLAAAAADFGPGIDVWVNNAGVLAVGEFDATPMEVTQQVVSTNLLGYMHGAHAVLPYFKKQQRGILINNISIGGFLPVPGGAGYSASKFGLRGFSAALKGELRRFPDIHVCDAYPAFLDTPGIQHAANYTGKVLRPGPPVYDPQRLAHEVVALAEHPQSEKMVGSFSTLMRMSYAAFPALTRAIAGTVIRSYLKQADEIARTNGNIFTPVKYGNAVHGGWGLPGKPKAHRKYLAAGIVFSLALVTAKLLRR
ncbi:short-chain dehydrogenase [Pedobacter yulinensis]|uniref:Short-chain dehydrogenase n=1 Tax=Pedobacter yulinensis TaxID=2126353 RepID=A0A2T3HKZ8_9SPHI|nr:SDR family oxidoreductase [Pedobacter yulinensis]PST83138.1 short-chain dehydrogenase [Pedobacter yulinensis]